MRASCILTPNAQYETHSGNLSITDTPAYDTIIWPKTQNKRVECNNHGAAASRICQTGCFWDTEASSHLTGYVSCPYCRHFCRWTSATPWIPVVRCCSSLCQTSYSTRCPLSPSPFPLPDLTTASPPSSSNGFIRCLGDWLLGHVNIRHHVLQLRKIARRRRYITNERFVMERLRSTDNEMGIVLTVVSQTVIYCTLIYKISCQTCEGGWRGI